MAVGQMSGSSADENTSSRRFPTLNDRQELVFEAKIERFRSYLETRGKDPTKDIGYSNPGIRISRFLRMVRWRWSQTEPAVSFTTTDGDAIVDALNTDTMRKGDGDRFSESSKRKFSDVLDNWFAFQDVEWEPDVAFSDERASDKPDPYTKRELKLLWETSLTYKSIPRYNNLSPEERDRWKAHLAQELGKPKEAVTPDDWDRVNKNWKIPSLIRTAREAGWRPALVGKMEVSWYNPENKSISIPGEKAIKNDSDWEQELTDEAAFALEQWFEQRTNMEKYDGKSLIWLNRQGNPYDSGSLNTLIRNLIDEAGITHRGRKLVWYSFRHSIGTYVFAETQSLKTVAEVLRQNSKTAAEQYVHTPSEVTREAASIM